MINLAEKDLSQLSKSKLKKLIADTQSALEELNEELERRELDNQHEEVENLEEHFKDVEHYLANILSFFKLAIQDIKKKK